MEWNAAAIAAAIGRPRGLRAVLLTGARGGFGDATGSSRGLSGRADLRWLLTNRALGELLVVSVGTALRERYPTTSRPRGEFAELRSSVGLPAELPVVVISDDAGRQSLARERGYEVWDFAQLASLLPQAGWVCEGGPRLVDRLAEVELLAELAWSRSPALAAATTPTPALDAWRTNAKSLWTGRVEGFDFALLTSGSRGQ